jgi:predicted ATPase
MAHCECAGVHTPRRLVLTGGPGAGKTAVLELIRQAFCEHVVVLPEAAGIVFGGGFPRGNDHVGRRAVQRAIYYVQRELEAVATASQPAVILCDRGTVDGAAYWPGPAELWSEVGTTHAAELARYDKVIHLRTPSDGSYNRNNPLRVETVAEARAIDDRIADAWRLHPQRLIIEATEDFLTKAATAIDAIKREVPQCCGSRVFPRCEGHKGDPSLIGKAANA